MTQASVNLRRKPGRAVISADVSDFAPMVDKAMEAFCQDVSYAVLMARAAVTIIRKREVWQARRDARSQGS